MDTYPRESSDDLPFILRFRARRVSSTDGPFEFSRGRSSPLKGNPVEVLSTCASHYLPLHTSLAACNNGTLEDFNAEIE